MKIEVSVGEVIDKITILRIKKDKIKDEKKLNHINKELDILESALLEYKVEVPIDMTEKLQRINLELWEAEDTLREKESLELYDEEFIRCAIADSVLNDKRFLIKNEINNYCDSNIKEQKSYEGLYTSN